MRRASKELERRRRAYVKLRDAFMADNPWCIRCGAPSEELHHARGRVAGDLLDVSTFRAMCSPCHRYAGDNPQEAYARGWSLRRVGRAS